MQEHAGQPGEAMVLVLSTAAPGLLGAGTALDALAAGRDGVLTWMAFWAIATGVALGTWCATWACVDWAFAGQAERGIRGLEGISIATVVGLYGLVALLRLDSSAHSATAPAWALEVCAATLLGMKAWLGNELATWRPR
ncbi:MAG: hypothetical protein WBY94_21705 [Polyangiaceae bacterium]